MIAIALSCGPALLLADEPTTALDVTVQKQVLIWLTQQKDSRQMAMVLVTHDLGVVAAHSDQVAVMYAGRIVELAPTRSLFAAAYALHRSIFESIPRAGDPATSVSCDPWEDTGSCLVARGVRVRGPLSLRRGTLCRERPDLKAVGGDARISLRAGSPWAWMARSARRNP